MIPIRPVWDSATPKDGLPAQVLKLLEVEERIVNAAVAYLGLARSLLDEEYVDELASLMRSSHKDLIGGCEMARTGYFKQAYSLWRSWFEQAIFFLYFLEAPLHKAAWKVRAEIDPEESPQYRLMLHQLLQESSEKHPFTLVYETRFASLIAALKISSVPRASRPIQRANRVLTALSQGVHGTYQPYAAEHLDQLDALLGAHCNPILNRAEQALNTFWILLLTDIIALPEEVLVKLREGHVQPQELRDAGVDEAERVAAIAPFFAQVFPPP